MTALFIYIKHRFPGLWRVAERVNGTLFALFYPGFGETAARILREEERPDFRCAPVEHADLSALSAFLLGQPEESLACFAPHPFDTATLERLWRNPSFVMMKTVSPDDRSLTGYFFLRCFFIGKAFHGLLVDAGARNRNIGTAMWALSARICRAGRLRMFATVSAGNKASLRSACNGTDVRVVRELPGKYLLIACRPKES